MSDRQPLPTREETLADLRTYERFSMNVMGEDWGDIPYSVVKAYVEGRLVEVDDLITHEEAATAMMTFFNEHAGDIGQHWPTVEDALAWLEASDESEEGSRS